MDTVEQFAFDTSSSNIPFYVYQQMRINELEKEVQRYRNILSRIEPKSLFDDIWNNEIGDSKNRTENFVADT